MIEEKERYADPRYEHDCTTCVYLGRFNQHDLYVHAVYGIIDTIIARHSSDGPDYYSGLSFCKPYVSITGKLMEPKPYMAEGLRRALELGFIDNGKH